MSRYSHFSSLDEASKLARFPLLTPNPAPDGIMHAIVRPSGEYAVVSWSSSDSSFFMYQGLEMDFGAGRDRFQERVIQGHEFMIREPDELDRNSEITFWRGGTAVRLTSQLPVAELVTIALTIRAHASSQGEHELPGEGQLGE